MGRRTTISNVTPVGEYWVDSSIELPKRHDYDEYRTPLKEVNQAYCQLLKTSPELSALDQGLDIVDVGAGSNGIWGEVAKTIWDDAYILGVEIQNVDVPKYYDEWVTKDYREWSSTTERQNCWDLVVGNPPFCIANDIVFNSLDLLRPGGHLMLLLRLSFAAGQFRRDHLFKKYPPKKVAVYSRRVSWYGTRKTNTTDYGLYIWQKDYQGITQLDWIG